MRSPIAALLTLALLQTPFCRGDDAPPPGKEAEAAPAEKPTPLEPAAEDQWPRKDLPVPACLEFDESRCAVSEEADKGEGPKGVWVLKGEAAPDAIAAFFKERLDAHGWKQEGKDALSPAGDTILAFKRKSAEGPTLKIEVSQHEQATWLEIRVE